MRPIFIISCLFLALLACKNTKKIDKETKTSAKILFNEKSHDFGFISLKDSIEHDFVIENIGEVPLIIQSVKASCGCTVPGWSSKPILPLAKSVVKVKFKPKDKGVVNKSIVLQANTDSMFHVFYLKGNVR